MDEKLRIVRLTTGEEILGEIEEQNDETVRIKNPCVLGITMNQSGKAGWEPWLLWP